MGKTISRQALYDAVWAQPMSKLSKEFGLSDVGLAKACRKLSVPLPPRGYWARKTAGKPVVQATLPPRPPGLGEETTIGGDGNTWGWRGPPDEVFLGDVPLPPSFDELIEDVRARVETMIGKAPVVARDLEQPHPVVAKFLRQDDERRAKAAGRSYVSLWEQVVYGNPIQQRRLRLLSSILMTAGRCGCRGELGMRPEMGQPQTTSRSSLVTSELDSKLPRRTASLRSAASRSNRGLRRPYGSALATVCGMTSTSAMPRSTRGGRRLGRAGRGSSPGRAVSGRAWWLEQRAAVLERRRKEAEEADRRERERVAELERKRVERLLGEAEALRNARAIRAYVEEVRAAAPAVLKADLDAWAGWALAQADRIDPVLTGAFLRKTGEG